MRPTPATDKVLASCNQNSAEVGFLDLARMHQHAVVLERLLLEARDALKLAAALPTHQNCPAENHGIVVVAMETLARIDATLDPNCLEGPPRTPEDRIADARALDEVAPTPADKFALMFRGTPNPDYVPAPMEVAMTAIDPTTGEVKQGVARSEGELRAFFSADDDLDEPLPPKQCGLDDPECESCQ